MEEKYFEHDMGFYIKCQPFPADMSDKAINIETGKMYIKKTDTKTEKSILNPSQMNTEWDMLREILEGTDMLKATLDRYNVAVN